MESSKVLSMKMTNTESNNMQDIVELNIGGRIYKTYRETVCQYRDSTLAKMVMNQNSHTDCKGRVFIDRDGKSFRFILNFLRTGVSILPDSRHEREQLKLEVDFYRIKPLMERMEKLNVPMNDVQLTDWKNEDELIQVDSVFKDHEKSPLTPGKQLTIVWERDHPDPRDAGFVKVTGKVGNLFEHPSPLSLEVSVDETIKSYVSDVAVYDTVNEVYLTNPEMLFNFLQDSGYTKYNGGEFGSEYIVKHEGRMQVLGRQWKFLKL